MTRRPRQLKSATRSNSTKQIRARASSDIVLWLGWVGYVILISYTSFHHEIWRDEGDVWLAVRDDSIAGITARAAHAGTPVLWYVIVKPLAVAALPHWTMQVLHVLIASLTAFLILFRSPFAIAVRLALIFGYYFSYEWAVISRNYAIGALLLLLAVHAWSYRRLILCGLLIGFLVNTSVHALAIGCVLTGGMTVAAVLRRRANRSLVVGSGLAALGISAAIIQLYPASGGQLPPMGRGMNLEAVSWTLQGVLAPRLDPGLLDLRSVTVLLLFSTALILRPALRVAFVAATAALFGIFIFVYSVPDGYRHFGFVWLCVVAFRWIYLEHSGPDHLTERVARWIFGASLAILVAVGGWTHFQDVRKPYSGSEETATFLRTANLLDHRFVFHPSYLAGSILPLIPGKQGWFLAENRAGTYAHWDAAMAEAQTIDLAQITRRMKSDGKWEQPMVLITHGPAVRDSEIEGTLVFTSASSSLTRADEQFYVYLVGSGH